MIMGQPTDSNSILEFLEGLVEQTIFKSRWLLAPLYMGLVLGLVLLLFRFVLELFHIIPLTVHGTIPQLVLGLLELVDMVLFGNLLLIVLFSGYSNFVSHINPAHASEDRPTWLDHVDFGNLKLKVIGSIVAISAISLLGAFIEIDKYTKENLAWKVGIHMVFVFSAILFAITEWIQKKTEAGDGHHSPDSGAEKT